MEAEYGLARDSRAIEDISFKLPFQALRHRLHHALRKMTSESLKKVPFTEQVGDSQTASLQKLTSNPRSSPFSPVVGWGVVGANKSITSVVKESQHFLPEGRGLSLLQPGKGKIRPFSLRKDEACVPDAGPQLRGGGEPWESQS